MARSRNIKPGLFQNEYLAELGSEAQLVFAGLATLADRDGWLEDRPKRIKTQLMPYSNCDMEKILQSLANSPERFIERREANGGRYIYIRNFHLHQTPHHTERASVISPLFNGALTSGELCPPSRGNQESVTGNQESVPPTPEPEVPPKRRSFEPPTVDEVRTYCSERQNGVDPRKFVDFYASKGWVVGKTRMKDWKACVRTWEARDLEARGSPSSQDPRGTLSAAQEYLAHVESRKV